MSTVAATYGGVLQHEELEKPRKRDISESAWSLIPSYVLLPGAVSTMRMITMILWRNDSSLKSCVWEMQQRIIRKSERQRAAISQRYGGNGAIMTVMRAVNYEIL